ncbi:MAG: hypothetical protein E7168_04690 [Firmicutes bacterium]|nr:hypothetical protein [Bacillota bacterium]
MEIRIGDKKDRISERHLLLVPNGDKGSEGKVYVWKKQALKIYNPYRTKKVLDKDTANLIASLKTNRIIGLDEIVTNKKHQMIGYTMPLIKDTINLFDGLPLIDKETLLTEIDLLIKDVVTYSEAFIEFNDFGSYNTLLTKDGNIYFIDPGSYEKSELDIPLLEMKNMESFNWCWHAIISQLLRINIKNPEDYKKIRNDFFSRWNKQSDLEYSKFLEKEMENTNNLDEYVLKLKRF